MLVMQAGDDKIVNKDTVKEWFNHAPLSEKRFKEWPKVTMKFLMNLNGKMYSSMRRILSPVN